MSITRVQGTQINSAGTGTSQAITVTGVTLGNLLVASVACGSNNTTITGPARWTQATINQPAGASATIETSIWYLVVGASDSGATSFTWTFSASHSMYICFEEWSASAGWPASPLDVVAQGDTAGTPVTATTIVSGTTATTAQAEELWIAALAYKNSAQTETSITSGWTKDVEATLAANNTLTMLYNVASSTGTAACSYVIGTGQFWAGSVATFKDNTGVSLAKTLAGVGTLTGTLTRKTALSKTIAGVGTLTGTISVPGAHLSSTLAGVGTLSGTTTRKTALSKTLAGTGTLAGTLRTSFLATLAGRGTLRATLTVPAIPAPNAPTYTVFVGNVQLYIIAGTLNIQNTIGRRGQASFMARTTTATHFQQYMPVTIYDASNTLAFSGYITQPKEQKPGFQNSLLHTIQCVDQHYLADKRRIAASYTNKTCGYIAQDIVKTILSQEGVSVGMIYDGLTPSDTLYPDTTLYPGGNIGLIPQATFVYAKVSDALDELVKAASASGVPYYWQIDQYKQLWFVPYTAVVNSTIVDGSAIDQVLNPPYVQRANPTYRNSQYILGGVAQTVTQTEVRKGDANTQSWTMGYALSTAPTITVNGTGQTVGIKGASGSQFYWAQGDNIVTQDSAQTKLISTDTLQVVYVGQYPSVISSSSAGQIAYQQSVDGTSGIVEDAISDATLTSIGNGLTEASQLLTRYGVQGTLAQFSTLIPGYAQGQLITVNLPMHALNNAQMLIENVVISDQTDLLNIWYQITAVQGPYDTTWVQFFSSLLAQQAPANSINVGVTQSVTLLASFVGNVTPSCTLSVSVFACPIPSNSLFPSTSLFPC